MSSELQHKMYNYEVQPPPESWNSIVAALDEEINPLAERLNNFEATPPAAVWKHIETALDHESKVVPIRRNNIRRFAIAAALLALIVLSGMFLLKNNKESETALLPNQPNTNSNSNPERAIVLEPLDEQSQTSHVQTAADRHITYGSKPNRISVSNSISRSQQINAPEKIEPARKISFDYTVDRYMVYSDGDGNAMRLSKKLFDAISCVQVDVACRDRIQSIQQKIAGSSLTSDFTAVLEMLNNLKENQ